MKRVLLVVFVLASFGGGVSAVEFGFAGVRTFTVFGFLPVPTGLDIRLRFFDSPENGFPGSIVVGAGGGFERNKVFRDAAGEPITGGYEESDIEIGRLELYLQPMVSLVPAMEIPLTFDFGFRTHFRQNFIFEGTEPRFSTGEFFAERDLEGALVNTLRGGLRYAKVGEPGSHGEIRGLDLSTMVEYGPEFLGNRIYPGGASPASDYLRINGIGRGYLPVFDAEPERKLNLFNLSLAGQIVADLLTGSTVPLNEQAYTRGYIQSWGLGRLIRGYEESSYPALLKLAANAEIRMVGPAFVLPWLDPVLSLFGDGFFSQEWFAPVLTLFVDTGYYSGFRAGGYFAPSEDGLSEVLVSTGATLAINLLGIVQVGYSIAIPIQGERADGAPIGHGIVAGFHF